MLNNKQALALQVLAHAHSTALCMCNPRITAVSVLQSAMQGHEMLQALRADGARDEQVREDVLSQALVYAYILQQAHCLQVGE